MNIVALAACLVFGACEGPKECARQEAPSLTPRQIENMEGKNLRDLVIQFGCPDYILSRSNYQVMFSGEVQPEVVLTYLALKRRVYITENGMVLAVERINKGLD